MRIKRIFVKQLFHLFDHQIEMKLTDRITIVHAPNGFGKTAMLVMTHGLFNSRYAELRSFPFETFGVEFDDGKYLTVTKSQTNGNRKSRSANATKATLVFSSGPNQTFEQKAIDRRSFHFPIEIIDQQIPDLFRFGPETWRTSAGEVLQLEDVIERYQDLLPFRQMDLREEPEWLKAFKAAIDVRLIRTDRLAIPPQPQARVRRARPGNIPTVMTYSEELASDIKSILANYAEISQSLDRTFPVRLVSDPAHPALSKNALSDKLREFELKRSRLAAAGLLDQEREALSVPGTIDETKASVLSVYVRDVEQKLGVFDSIAAKIELFKSLINKRFRHKQMSISRENGLVFTTAKNEPLPAISLSSGEQHEVVLLYELLFKVRKESLVLIDEPEISLHVAWQEQFLRDLLEMTKLSGFDVLLATHSPQIISDRWDLTVELHDAK